MGKAATARLPILPLTAHAVFPGCRLSILVHSRRGRAAVDAAMNGSRWVLLTGPAYPGQNEGIGVVASVNPAREWSEAGGGIEFKGGRRVFLDGDSAQGFSDGYKPLPFRLVMPQSQDLFLGLLRRWNEYAATRNRSPVPQGSAESQMDWIASQLGLPPEQAWGLVREADPVNRARLLVCVLDREINAEAAYQSMQGDAAAHVQKTVRRDLLRRQLEWTENELADIEEQPLRSRLQAAEVPPDVRVSCRMALRRLHGAFEEAVTARGYLDFVSRFPWREEAREPVREAPARPVIWGGKYVEERIADLGAEGSHRPAICLAGPPGVGKTYLAEQIALRYGLAFASIPLGGARGDAMLRGLPQGRIEAAPGRILKAIQEAGTRDLLILLDDIDKVEDNEGQVWAALLEILDPLQRRQYFDRYLGHRVDLSRCWFVVAANDPGQLPSGLRDRLEVVWLRGYDDDEKKRILRDFIWPKTVAAMGHPELRLAPPAARLLLASSPTEAGVRELERKAGRLARRWLRKPAGKSNPTVTGAFARQALGPVTNGLPIDAPGRVFGLAWTPLGGTVMPVEVAVLAGEGGVRVTGRVGEVMGESLQAAYTWLRIHARSIGIPPELSQRAMHVHFPEAATPKDGPSAGLTLVAGMLSALSNQVALPRAAFTGEITILGEVLPVGGIREKLLAALRSGIRTVILPEENRKDVGSLSPRDRKRLTIHFVRRLDDFVAILTAGDVPELKKQGPNGEPDAGHSP